MMLVATRNERTHLYKWSVGHLQTFPDQTTTGNTYDQHIYYSL